jgi:hypothetical protein
MNASRRCIGGGKIGLGVFAAAVVAASPAIADDNQAFSLTIYNGGFALVRDQRPIAVTSGVSEIDVENVAARIDPTSVLMRCLDAPNSIDILEQNYRYDVISPETLLDKAVGQPISILQTFPDGRQETMRGTLMNPATPVQIPGRNFAGSTGPVVVLEDGTVVLRPQGQITLDAMPPNVTPRPTLNWIINSAESADRRVELTYMTEGIGWEASYVALVGADEKTLDLAGWVTLDNQSGMTYTDAELTLMAGDVRRIQQPQPQEMYYARAAMADMALGAPQFEEQSFFDYHLYTMARPTTIRDREIKQLSLLNAEEVPVEKRYIYDPRGTWFSSWWGPGRGNYDPGAGGDTITDAKINMKLRFENREENNLGMPLPKGKVRVHKMDNAGRLQFVGEDEIDHTPRNETLSLYIGDAFDVVGEFKRTDYRRIDDRTVRESFEVELRNRKEEAVTVTVIGRVWSEWEVLAKSHEFEKKDARTIEFQIPVEPDSTTTLTYTVQTRW